MIRVNASLIKDYITCPKRAWYRMNIDKYDVVEKEFPYLTVGKIVHEAIAVFHNNFEKAVDFVTLNSAVFSLPESYATKAMEMIRNFFAVKDELKLDLSGAKLEQSFEYEDKKHKVVFTGRFDCVMNSSVYDWKTSTSLPRDVGLDPQFIIYDRAIEQITGKRHSLYYIYLKSKRVIEYKRNTEVAKIFFDEILDAFKEDLKRNTFERRGLFDYNDLCRSCPFMDICFKESSIFQGEDKPGKMSLF